MKKLILLLTLVGFLWGTSAFGAWDCTESRREYNNGNVAITVVCTSDGSAGSYDIATYMSNIKGHYLYTVEVIPGSGGVAPDNTFDLDVEDSDDFHILDTDGNSNTAKEWHLGNSTLGQYPMIRDLITLVFADIGTANDQVTVVLDCPKQ